MEDKNYWSKDNPLLIGNIMVLIIGLVILWNYRKSPGVWAGVAAMMIMSIRFWAGDKKEENSPELKS